MFDERVRRTIRIAQFNHLSSNLKSQTMNQLNLEAMESIVGGGDATYRIGNVIGGALRSMWDALGNAIDGLPRVCSSF